MKKLETMDAEFLMALPLLPISYVVEGLIPYGLHLLAGTPKIGKSWLVLWMCLQITKGEPIWGMETEKSEVLYLCLEDSFSRIQSRLFDITDEAPSTLHFATFSDSIGDGLENQIDLFLKDHPNTKFICIDTLQKVRRGKVGGNNMYESDYEDIGAIKSIADKNHIAILLVHHLRKSKDSDPFNMISGSNGIAGATDSNFILYKDQRMENRATLACTGRDIPSREISLEFQAERFTWELVNPLVLEEEQVAEFIISLCDYIKSVGEFTGTATELIEAMKPFTTEEITPPVLKKKIIKHMAYMEKQNIAYSSNRTFARREFTLRYDSNDDMTVESHP